jgi:DHA2 family multidrug resistance protein-like MFS transporter
MSFQQSIIKPSVLTAAEIDGIAAPRRYWAHLAIGMAVTMSSMDGSIANVALPTIVHVLHISPASSIWVVNAYQLSACMALLVLGSLGDIYGYDRIFRICLALFTLASLACALSHNLEGLATARFIQGMGGAGILGVTNAMLRGIYPRSELAMGIGRNTVVVAISLVMGPTVASFILSVASWPWLFAVNVPLGILTLTIAHYVLPPFPRSTHRFDVTSAILSAMTFGLLVLGIDGIGHRQASAIITAELVMAIIFGTALIRRQKSMTSPLLPMDLLRIRLFALSVSTTFMASMGQLMAYVAIPFLLHQLGRSPVQIGLLITPWPVMVGAAAPMAGRLTKRFRASVLASTGLVILAAGLVLVARLPAGASTMDIIWRMLICGIGYGIFLPPNSSTQISAVPKQRSGGASTMGATGRVLGQSIGAALVAGLFEFFSKSGAEFALFAAAMIILTGAVVSMLRTTSVQT